MSTAVPVLLGALPALFMAHGSPMHAIQDTPMSRAWRALGEQLPRPAAILCVSAHWETVGVAVTAMDRPRTIHDFGGFPQALFDVQYPAPGSPALAERVAALLAPEPVHQDQGTWGLDHGTWSVLVHMYPQADIPVVQLSLDMRRSGEEHLALARRLAPLRDEGVLVIGSGNIVHNLRTARRGDNPDPYPWAIQFDELVAAALMGENDDAIAHWEKLDPQARFSVPTPEHYLPLLYIAALRRPADRLSFPTAGIEWGSLSMRSVAYGLTPA